jgi:hypothetical protein
MIGKALVLQLNQTRFIVKNFSIILFGIKEINFENTPSRRKAKKVTQLRGSL